MLWRWPRLHSVWQQALLASFCLGGGRAPAPIAAVPTQLTRQAPAHHPVHRTQLRQQSRSLPRLLRRFQQLLHWRPPLIQISLHRGPTWLEKISGQAYISGLAKRSCYWARLKDLSGSLDSILANDNSVGQYYIRVKASDFALETKCELLLLSALPKPAAQMPSKIEPGSYLVGIDIQPGTYQGHAVAHSCYWARLSDMRSDRQLHCR